MLLTTPTALKLAVEEPMYNGFTFCLVGVGIPIANIYFWAWVFSLKVAAVTSCGECLTFIECSSFCL